MSGAKSAAELCREHQLNPQLLARWETEFLERAPLLFQQEAMQSQEQERIAELERVVIDRPGVPLPGSEKEIELSRTRLFAFTACRSSPL